MIFCAQHPLYAQSKVFNKYGLYVTNNTEILRKEIAADSNRKMIDLKESTASK